jgi:hypothetical protein
MVSVNKLRSIALALPEPEGRTHFRWLAFKVKDKNKERPFVAAEKGDTRPRFVAESVVRRVAEIQPFLKSCEGGGRRLGVHRPNESVC